MILVGKTKYFLVIILTLFIFNFSFAEDISITQFPDSPREGEEVKLTVESDKYNLNIANITWSIDGEEKDQGVGRTTFTMKAPENGLGQIVLVKIEQEGFDGGEIQKVVEANTNFILYEGADSYTPPFYKGRALPPKEGTVRAAIFSFKNGNITGFENSELENYTWVINGEKKTELSGQNRIINNIQPKVIDKNLKIKISKEESGGGTKITETNIPLQNTELIVYKTDQKKLIKQILNTTETGKKIFLLVEPFFFSAINKTDNVLSYIWKINNIESKISTPWSVFFSNSEKGEVQINLDVLNKQKITQESERGFTFKTE